MDIETSKIGDEDFCLKSENENQHDKFAVNNKNNNNNTFILMKEALHTHMSYRLFTPHQ